MAGSAWLLARRGELTVTELANDLGVELPMLSRHLAVLREAGLFTQVPASGNGDTGSGPSRCANSSIGQRVQ